MFGNGHVPEAAAFDKSGIERGYQTDIVQLCEPRDPVSFVASDFEMRLQRQLHGALVGTVGANVVRKAGMSGAIGTFGIKQNRSALF